MGVEDQHNDAYHKGVWGGEVYADTKGTNKTTPKSVKNCISKKVDVFFGKPAPNDKYKYCQSHLDDYL